MPKIRFTLDDIKRKGLTIIGDKTSEVKPMPDTFKNIEVKQGRPKLPAIDASGYNEVQEHLSELQEKCEQNKSCKIVINGIIPGLNGSNGLMQKHWTKNKNIKEGYISLIGQQKTISFDCPVEIHYTGYKTKFMDWDNFCASFKHLGDGLAACGIIKDDSPETIKHFIPHQVKCKRKDQRVEILIMAI